MFRTKILNLAVLIVWFFVIFLLSSEPSSLSSSRSNEVVQIIQSVNTGLVNIPDISFFVRKLAHIIAYFILGVLMFLVVRAYTPKARKAIILSVLFVFIYAVTDEFHQTFVPGRSGEVRDVLIDTTAGTAGVSACYFAARFMGVKKSASY
jgi:VanZ family protein